jgi:hypothetical protein
VLYSIRTADGLLAESIPLTITNIDRVGEGTGESYLQSNALEGSFRASTALGKDPRISFGIVVTQSQPFGGVQLRYESQDNLSQFNVTLGRWPPVQQ